jgi:ribosomal protein L37AE/L43A
MSNKKHKLIFSSLVTKLSNAEINKNISLAGLDKLKSLMPNIDLENNPDLIGIVLNAAVGNMSNRNHDAITNKTLVAIAKNFINKPCDFLHKRDKILGFIINSGYSEYKTNKILTAEEAENSVEPVNLSLAVLLWKSVLSEKYINLLEASADENSPDYGSISASWELWYDDVDICVSPDGKISTGTLYTGEEAKKLEASLPQNMGKGYLDGQMVFQVLKHDNDNIVLPAGIGLVENPAAHVKGLEIVTQNDLNNMKTNKANEDMDEDDKMEETHKVCPECKEESEGKMEDNMMTCAKCGKKTEMALWKDKKAKADITLSVDFDMAEFVEYISKKENRDNIMILAEKIKGDSLLRKMGIEPMTIAEIVKKHGGPINIQDINNLPSLLTKGEFVIKKSKLEKNSVTNLNDSKNNMKLSKLEDITEANLKDLSVANLHELVETRIREAAKTYEADVNKHKNDVAQLTKDKEALEASVKEAKDKVSANETELNQLKEQFNKLVEANVARETQIKFDERMAALASKFKLSDKQKEVVVNRVKSIKTDEEFVAYASELELFYKPEAEATESAEDKAKKEKELAEASTREALAKAEKEKLALANTQQVPEDYMDKARKAFGRDNIEIVYSNKK